MKANHSTSRKLWNWGGFNSVVGIVLTLFGLFAAIMDSDWGAGLAAVGVGLLVSGPLLKGLSVLVENAESEIAEREEREMKNDTTDPA